MQSDVLQNQNRLKKWISNAYLFVWVYLETGFKIRSAFSEVLKFCFVILFVEFAAVLGYNSVWQLEFRNFYRKLNLN